tara:strand:- start:2 stop:400 length:399 start_codon:yes stop_codon:yes gene_type:complete
MQIKTLLLVAALSLPTISVANTEIVKKNAYGALSVNLESNTFLFSGSRGDVSITNSQSVLKYLFEDGSFIRIDLASNELERFSAKTKRSEVFTSVKFPESIWDVSDDVRASFEQFQNFSESPAFDQSTSSLN